MSDKQDSTGLAAALQSPDGELDAWLEVQGEAEIRAAILSLVAPVETLRDKFAGQAMQALVMDGLKRDGSATVPNVAKDAYRMADAMLAARSAS